MMKYVIAILIFLGVSIGINLYVYLSQPKVTKDSLLERMLEEATQPSPEKPITTTDVDDTDSEYQFSKNEVMALLPDVNTVEAFDLGVPTTNLQPIVINVALRDQLNVGDTVYFPLGNTEMSVTEIKPLKKGKRFRFAAAKTPMVMGEMVMTDSIAFGYLYLEEADFVFDTLNGKGWLAETVESVE